MVAIQMQNTVSRNWMTMKNVPNIDLIVQQALDELKKRYPSSGVRATLNGAVINIIP